MSKKKGQAVTIEYVIMILMIVTIILGMTAFIRRAIAGRIHDAGGTAVTRASAITGNMVLIEYEPYYAETHGTSDRSQEREERVISTGATVLGTISEVKSSTTSSQFAPSN